MIGNDVLPVDTGVSAVKPTPAAGLAAPTPGPPHLEVSVNQPSEHVWIRYVAWAVLLAAALLQAWGSRHLMNPDGTSYLDLARAAARGEWGDTINPYWSPLYPWLLGIALSLVQPDSFWEYSVAHAVNLGVFLVALVVFEMFLRQLLAVREQYAREHGAVQLPPWAWRTIGYASFGWAALYMSGTARVTPDLLVVVVVFAAAAIMLVLARRDVPVRWFAALGAVLAVGYMAKAALLPLSAALLFAAWFAGHRMRARGILLAIAGFLLLSAPYLTLLARQEGRFTIGSTGRLNYAWFVNAIPRYKHWNGDPPEAGTPLHPTKVFDQPATFDFAAAPIAGTYPVWTDPSYWHEGLSVRFNPLQQLKRAAAEIKMVPWMVVDLFLPLVAMFVLYLRGGLQFDRRYTLLLGIPLVATVAMYTLVHIEQRFIAGFLGVFVAGSLLMLKPSTVAGREAMLVVMLAFAAWLSTHVVELGARSWPSIRAQVAQGRLAHHEWVTAQELARAGIAPGSDVAFIGDGFRAYWAQLGHYRITGEVATQQFQRADPASRQSALATLARAPQRSILADSAIVCASDQGWRRIPNTPLCAYGGLPTRHETAGR